MPQTSTTLSGAKSHISDVTGTDISFNATGTVFKITSTTTDLSVFAVRDLITVTGTTNNNKTFTVKTVSSSTELIVEEVLNNINNSSSKNLLEIGTGSGCVIISIIKERLNCLATAIDISKKALKVAKTNAKIHHLENKIKFLNIDVDKFNYNKYDFILSNPPYINSIDIKRLDKDVRLYEPMVALLAGTDGLSQIRKLVNKSRTLLKKNGKLIFEIGKSQLNEVIRILKKNKFYINEICNDLQSYPRVIVSTKLF